MPIYLYEHPRTKEIKEIVQSVHDKHEYIESGIKWNRVFTIPQVGIDSKLDSYSTEKDFVEKTKNKKDSVGDLWDRSRELSEKRKKIYGKDPVKEKYFKDWSKKRKGKKHPKSGLN